MARLSILIPARNETLLQKTIDSIFQQAQGDTEVLVALDNWDNPPELRIAKGGFIRTNLGQRGATNALARLSNADYLMKLDAHCSLSEGFDVNLMAEMDDKTILSPLLLVLNPETWTINGRKHMAQFVFGRDFVMQHKEGEVGETMCLQGSAWMISRENYWKWNVCDETLGSWGGQAVELGITAYLNGGRCKTTRSAFYGHVFRQDELDFPYDRGERPGKFATEELKRRYEDKIGELVEKFDYPLDWKSTP